MAVWDVSMECGSTRPWVKSAWSDIRLVPCKAAVFSLHGGNHMCLLKKEFIQQKLEEGCVILVVGHRLEIIIDHRLESVAAVDAIF